MIILRAGAFDRVITIQSVTVTFDDLGETVETWADIITTHAQLIKSSAKEFIQAFGATSIATSIFRIRWIPGITLANRVSYETNLYLVKEIAEIGRRRGLELRCVQQP
jgi:SPP1 family predicted phage head-tail adaptor